MRRRLGVAIAAAIALLLVPAAVADARGMRLGFMDDARLLSAAPQVIAPWWDRAHSVRADLVRLNILWRQAAPQRPSSAVDAADPDWTGYRFEALDTALRQAADRGIGVLVNVYSAPDWAEGPRRARDAPAGTWRPNASAYEAFAAAVAKRYSGRWPDPLRPGATLPRAAAWQAWNEPNLPTYLTPQWTRQNGRLRAESPQVYRTLLNAFYRAVKRVDPNATVLTAGTAPYGDPPGVRRMMPARFVRELLCVSGGPRRFRRAKCPQRAQFDVLAHHPYSVGGPTRRALNVDDVNVPDLWKLTRPLRAAERLRTVLPAKRKRLWITEISWDSSPPDPQGVPIGRHARWLQESAYRLWRQGAEALIWLNIADQAPLPSYPTTYQSGVFFQDGRPKPAATAFRFPFVTDCAGRVCKVWLKTTPRTAVTIERRAGNRWRPALRARTNADGLLYRRLPPTLRGTLRARTATDTSLQMTAR